MGKPTAAKNSNRVRVMIPGAFRVEYTYTERKGSRNMSASGVIGAENTDEAGACVIATERRGHLTKFVIVSVEQDYTTRSMTREEEAEQGRKALDAIRAKRAAEAPTRVVVDCTDGRIGPSYVDGYGVLRSG